MIVNEPRDLNKVFGGTRITSYDQLKNKLIPPIQLLKNSSGLEFFELYRGQGSDTYRLECGLSRFTKDAETMKKMDGELQDRFVQEVYNGNLTKLEDSINPNFKPSFEKQWKLNFQAQHLGLKTRLLDWSIDWRIGLLFAVENESKFGEDGQFWVFYCPRKWRYNYNRREEVYTRDLNEIDSPHLVNMAFLLDEGWKEQTGTRRAGRQSGRFFVLPYNQSILPMEENEEIKPFLIKFIIDGSTKKQIKKDLYADGPSTEWAYYRKEDNLDEAIKSINDETIKKYG